jgi:hypothetical protein
MAINRTISRVAVVALCRTSTREWVLSQPHEHGRHNSPIVLRLAERAARQIPTLIQAVAVVGRSLVSTGYLDPIETPPSSLLVPYNLNIDKYGKPRIANSPILEFWRST